ncbi:hypothetical protein ACH5RR_036722 [Cinchona calisaya]|uniref:Uncharacterized protein n=1 Tax=Cinchona calisaya TaxID=153742 RepID=A0ABD2Y435_9GENT
MKVRPKDQNFSQNPPYGPTSTEQDDNMVQGLGEAAGLGEGSNVNITNIECGLFEIVLEQAMKKEDVKEVRKKFQQKGWKKQKVSNDQNEGNGENIIGLALVPEPNLYEDFGISKPTTAHSSQPGSSKQRRGRPTDLVEDMKITLLNPPKAFSVLISPSGNTHRLSWRLFDIHSTELTSTSMEPLDLELSKEGSTSRIHLVADTILTWMEPLDLQLFKKTSS